MLVKKSIMCLLFSLVGSAANAAVIVDNSPSATSSTVFGTWGNGSASQNFLVEFNLAAPTQIDGMGIYIPFPVPASAGYGVVIKIRADAGGNQPASTNLFQYAVTSNGTDQIGSGTSNLYRLHASFTPTTLGAGNWWIGESFAPSTGSGDWSSVDAGPLQPLTQVQLNGDNLNICCTTGNGFSDHPTIHSLAYQIEGNAVAAVPEPSTWAMMLLGFSSLGFMTYRKRKSVAAAAG